MTKEKILKLLIEQLDEQITDGSVDLLNHSDPGGIVFDNLDMDSLETLMLAMNMEEKLSVNLDIAEFPSNATLNEFAEYLHQLTAH